MLIKINDLHVNKERTTLTIKSICCISERVLGQDLFGLYHKVTSTLIKEITSGFPGGTVVGSLPANAGDVGSSPGLGGSHMPRNNQAREPQLLSLRVWSLCSATGEAATVRGPRTATKSGRPSLAATAESPRTETKTQHSQINK